jgi:hypothetical protein
MSETKTSSIITMGTTTAATSVVVEIPLEGGGGGVTTTWSAIKVKCEFLNNSGIRGKLRVGVLPSFRDDEDNRSGILPPPEDFGGLSVPEKC